MPRRAQTIDANTARKYTDCCSYLLLLHTKELPVPVVVHAIDISASVGTAVYRYAFHRRDIIWTAAFLWVKPKAPPGGRK